MVKKVVDLDLKMNEQFIASKSALYRIAEEYVICHMQKTHGLGRLIYLTTANWLQEIVADLEERTTDTFDGSDVRLLNFKDGTCVALDTNSDWALQEFIEDVLKA